MKLLRIIAALLLLAAPALAKSDVPSTGPITNPTTLAKLAGLTAAEAASGTYQHMYVPGVGFYDYSTTAAQSCPTPSYIGAGYICTSDSPVLSSGRWVLGAPTIPTLSGVNQTSIGYEGYDDFQRANGAINGTKTPSGQTWHLQGTGQATAGIVNGQLVSSTNVYAALQYTAAPKGFGVWFNFTRPTAAGGYNPDATGGAVILSQDQFPKSGEVLGYALHLVFGKREWNLQYIDYPTPDPIWPSLASGTWDLPDDGSILSLKIDRIDLVACSLRLVLPTGKEVSVTDSRICTVNPRWATAQIQANASATTPNPPVVSYNRVSLGQAVVSGDASATSATTSALYDLYNYSGIQHHPFRVKLSGAAGWYTIAKESTFGTMAIVGKMTLGAYSVYGAQRIDSTVDIAAVTCGPRFSLDYEWHTIALLSQMRLSCDAPNLLAHVDVYKNTTDDVYVDLDAVGSFTPNLAPVVGAAVLPTGSLIAPTVVAATNPQVDVLLNGAGGGAGDWYTVFTTTGNWTGHGLGIQNATLKILQNTTEAIQFLTFSVSCWLGGAAIALPAPTSIYSYKIIDQIRVSYDTGTNACHVDFHKAIGDYDTRITAAPLTGIYYVNSAPAAGATVLSSGNLVQSVP